MTQESRGHWRIVPSPSLSPTTSPCQFLILRPHARVVGVGNAAKQFSFRRCLQCMVHGVAKSRTWLSYFTLSCSLYPPGRDFNLTQSRWEETGKRPSLCCYPCFCHKSTFQHQLGGWKWCVSLSSHSLAQKPSLNDVFCPSRGDANRR